MSFSFGFIFLCVGVVLASEETYRAGLLGTPTLGDFNLDSYGPLIREAGKLNADILVLPSLQVSSLTSLENSCEIDNYDELVKTLATASKEASLYVVAHIIEKTRCQNKNELVRSNLVFDREGSVVSVYRKPLNNIANCTTTTTSIGSFSTDFGVQFGLLMEEDLVLQKVEDLKEFKNFVVAGAWSSDISFLSASQFASTWAFTNKVNLVSSSNIFAGRSGSKASSQNKVTVTDLKKLPEENKQVVPPVVNSLKLKAFTSEDLSQYIIRPLDVAASVRGYTETVCHGKFCCEFYVKTSFDGPKYEEVNYGLAAFDGVRQFDRRHNIGTQTCAVFACAGLYKRTCTLGSQNNSTNIVFEKISIIGNFTESSQYPIVWTTDSLVEPHKFNLEAKAKQVTLEARDVENLLTFGLFSRDFAKDTENFVLNTDSVSLYETINEEMTEFFDYVWIRLRVILVIASIYVLEMM